MIGAVLVEVSQPFMTLLLIENLLYRWLSERGRDFSEQLLQVLFLRQKVVPMKSVRSKVWGFSLVSGTTCWFFIIFFNVMGALKRNSLSKLTEIPDMHLSKPFVHKLKLWVGKIYVKLIVWLNHNHMKRLGLQSLWYRSTHRRHRMTEGYKAEENMWRQQHNPRLLYLPKWCSHSTSKIFLLHSVYSHRLEKQSAKPCSYNMGAKIKPITTS